MNEWKEWIERYSREVARRLPRSRRDDVAGELRSLLEDEVEEKIAERPDAPAEEIALERLRAHGAPDEVARRYRAEPAVLIGPALYPAFRLTAGIVLGVYALFTGIWLLGAETTTFLFPFRFQFTAAESWMDILAGAFANLGIVVLIFAAIERLGSGREEAEEWDPRSLPELPRPARASRLGHAIGVAAGVLILALLHWAPEGFGWFVVRGDDWGPFPVLDPNYRAFLPWLDVWIGAGVALDAWLVFRGRWTVATRAADGLTDLFGAWVLWRIVADGPFTRLDVAAKPIMGIVMVILVVSAVSELIRAAREVRESRLAVPEVSSV